MKVKSLSHVQLFATPWTMAHQAPLSMRFSRQEYRSGLPFPSAGDLPNPGIKSGSPALQADSLPPETPGSLPDIKGQIYLPFPVLTPSSFFWPSQFYFSKLDKQGCFFFFLISLLLLLSCFSRVRLLETPWTAVYQAPPSMGFSRQGYWSGLPLPSPMHKSEK